MNHKQQVYSHLKFRRIFYVDLLFAPDCPLLVPPLLMDPLKSLNRYGLASDLIWYPSLFPKRCKDF